MNLDLYSDRLILTPLKMTDVDLAVALSTDPEVVRYICDPMTEQEILEEMPDTIRRGGNGCIGIWCIADRDAGEKLGSAYLYPMPTEKDDVDYSLVTMGQMPDADIEVGYFLKPSAWGRGYATEICLRVLRFAFEETSLGEIVASVNAANVASRNVLEKSGFEYSGRALCWGEDSPIYKITRDEWLQLAR